MKKTCKGMSLMEIIISMLIYGIIALLVVEIMSVVNATITATNNMNKRLSYETKYADNFIVRDNGGDFASLPVAATIRYGTARDASGALDNTLASDLGGGTQFLGTMYTTHLSVDNGTTDAEGNPQYDVDTDGANYRFMTFTKLNIRTTSIYSPEFEVTLNFEPIKNTDITKIVVIDSDRANKASADASRTVTFTGADISGTKIFSADNTDAQNDDGIAIGSHTICIEIYKKITNPGTGNEEEIMVFDADMVYCTYVTPAANPVPSPSNRIYVDGTQFSFSYDATTGRYAMTADH